MDSRMLPNSLRSRTKDDQDFLRRIAGCNRACHAGESARATRNFSRRADFSTKYLDKTDRSYLYLDIVIFKRLNIITSEHDMPHRTRVTKELAEFLGVLSHPHRIRIVEELRKGEQDVNSLQAALGISHSGVSQHLMVLRAHRLVSERREGRHVHYQLRQPEIAAWLLEATRFLEKETVEGDELRKAINKTRKEWAPK